MADILGISIEIWTIVVSIIGIIVTFFITRHYYLKTKEEGLKFYSNVIKLSEVGSNGMIVKEQKGILFFENINPVDPVYIKWLEIKNIGPSHMDQEYTYCVKNNSRKKVKNVRFIFDKIPLPDFPKVMYELGGIKPNDEIKGKFVLPFSSIKITPGTYDLAWFIEWSK